MDLMWFSSFQTVPTHEPLCNGPRTQDYTSMGEHEGKTLQYFQPSSSEMRERTHLILKLFENTETNTWCLKIQCSENGGVRFCTVGCSVCTLLLCQSEMQKKNVYCILPGRVYCIYLNGCERGFRGTRSSI